MLPLRVVGIGIAVLLMPFSDPAAMTGASNRPNEGRLRAQGGVAPPHARLLRAGLLAFTAPVGSFAMDGDLVAARAEYPRDYGCGRVFLWRQGKGKVVRVGESGDCKQGDDEFGEDEGLAVGGRRVLWSESSHFAQQLVIGSEVTGLARVVAGWDPETSASHLVADGNLFAYRLSQVERDGWGVAIVDARSGWRVRAQRWISPVILALSADSNRVAALTARAVVLWGVDGRFLRRVRVADGATSMRLEGNDLVVLVRRGANRWRLDVHDARTGRARTRIVLAEKAREGADWVSLFRSPLRLMDVHAGTAVYAHGSRVHLLRLADGAKRTLRAPTAGPVDARLEEPGLSYAYNVGVTGRVAFVPLEELWKQR
jgi:hypothetical protein